MPSCWNPDFQFQRSYQHPHSHAVNVGVPLARSGNLKNRKWWARRFYGFPAFSMACEQVGQKSMRYKHYVFSCACPTSISSSRLSLKRYRPRNTRIKMGAWLFEDAAEYRVRNDAILSCEIPSRYGARQCELNGSRTRFSITTIL